MLISITEEETLSSNKLMNSYYMKNTDLSLRFSKKWDEEEESKNYDRLLLARNLLDLSELKKSAFVLKDLADDLRDQSAMFMHHYAEWMHADMKMREEMYQAEYETKESHKFGKNLPVNIYAKNIQEVYAKPFTKGELNDLNCYLYGLALKAMDKKELAIKAFTQALNQNPFLWSAWVELCLIICHDYDFSDGLEYLSQIDDHWMKNVYFACLMLENLKIQKKYEEYAFGAVIGLFCFFKESVFLMNQLAHIFYHNQDQQISLEIFQILLKKDPFRTENLDTYSNILYVKEQNQELGALAVHCFENNKYCPETCCVVGNYHSLISEHQKAIQFFKRALELDRNFLAACTLIGHEYLEMKGIPNAIDAYNSALNIDPKDFRAWYGLGQAYELQGMIQFSLNYFSKAVKSRPRDYRMWNALAESYKKLDRNEEATRCFEHSEFYKDVEGIALFNLGKMYNVLGYEEKAVSCFEEIISSKEQPKTTDENIGYIYIYLVQYYKKKGNYSKALQYANSLFDRNGNTREEAQNLVFELNTLMNQII